MYAYEGFSNCRSGGPYNWVEAMHDELNSFKRNSVWELVEKPKDYLNVIGTKWIFKNKQDSNGVEEQSKIGGSRILSSGRD